nr:hypothetical protein BSM_25970 [uncultured archaeon]
MPSSATNANSIEEAKLKAFGKLIRFERKGNWEIPKS